MSETKFKKPSKHLNENAVFLGLSYGDISGLGTILIIMILILTPLKSESTSYIALLVTLSLGLLLIPIRLTRRRKSVRDFLQSLIQPKEIK